MPRRYQITAAERASLLMGDSARGMPVRQTAPIFQRVWKAEGLPGKVPSVYSVPQVGTAGFVPFEGGRPVFIAPWVAKAMKAGPLSKDRAALTVLLHEYAHTRQPLALKRNLMEAGADLFSNTRQQDVEKKLGLGGPGTNWLDWGDPTRRPQYYGYPDLVTKLIRKPGWRQFLDKRQFGR